MSFFIERTIRFLAACFVFGLGTLLSIALWAGICLLSMNIAGVKR